MSFSVRAGDDDGKGVGGGSATPGSVSFSQSRHSTPSGYRISPHLLPVATTATTPTLTHQQLLAATYGQAFPIELSSLYTTTAAATKRVATDPSKYKTTICRNWSSRGTCTFRGCTFAHGIDDLRLPVRPNAAMFQLGNAPHHPSHSGGGSGGASLGHSSSGSGSAGGKPAGGTSNGNNSGTTSGNATSAAGHHHHHTPHSHVSSSGRGRSWEQLVSLLLANVKCRRETMAVHAEASRAMEEALQQEEAEMAQLSLVLSALQQQHDQLAMQIHERHALLRERAARYPEVVGKVERLFGRMTTTSSTTNLFGAVAGPQAEDKPPPQQQQLMTMMGIVSQAQTVDHLHLPEPGVSATAATAFSVPHSFPSEALLSSDAGDDVSEDTLQVMLDALKARGLS